MSDSKHILDLPGWSAALCGGRCQMARALPCWAHACPLRAPGTPEASVRVLRALQHQLLDAPRRELKMFSEKVALGPPRCVRHHQVPACLRQGTEGACPQRTWELLITDGIRQWTVGRLQEFRRTGSGFLTSGQQ